MRPTHILILLIVILILFGAKRLPDLARSIGTSLKIFKKEVSELQEDDSASSGQTTVTTVTQDQPTSGTPDQGQSSPTQRSAPAAPTEQ